MLGRRVLRHGDGGVRHRRAVPDARVRDDGSRPRDEQLDVGRVPVSDQADQPRQALDGGEAEGAWRVGPLQGRRRRRHPVPHDPGRRHAGVLHARLRPQRQGAVQRAARRLRGQHGPAGAQVRDGAQARAQAGDRPEPEGEDRPHRLRHLRIRDRGEPRSAARGDESRDVVLPAARVPVQRGARAVRRRARAPLRHRAEPRRAALAADEAGARARAADQAPQRAALQRPADRRAQHHRRRAGAGRLRGSEKDGDARERRHRRW